MPETKLMQTLPKILREIRVPHPRCVAVVSYPSLGLPNVQSLHKAQVVTLRHLSTTPPSHLISHHSFRLLRRLPCPTPKEVNNPAKTMGPPEDQGETRTRRMEGQMTTLTETKAMIEIGGVVDPGPITIWTNPSLSMTSCTYYDRFSGNVRVCHLSQPLAYTD